MVDRTGNYYQTFKNHRQALKTTWRIYDTRIKELEQHKGSEYYEQEARKAAEKRDTAISATQSATGAAFDEILRGMRESAKNRPMEAPTAEQLGLVQALKLREKISRTELEQAGRTLKDAPVCLSVLQELAEKNGYLGMHLAAESTESIVRHVESLAHAAQKALKLTKPDSRREQIERASVFSAGYSPTATETLLVDRDFDSEESLLAFLGNVQDITAFRAAVND